MLEFDNQWQEIMSGSQFSEEVTITLKDGETKINVTGLFYSGTYSDDASAPYTPKKGSWKEYFQFSERTVSEGTVSVRTVSVTSKELQSTTLERHGVTYRVQEVRGVGSGMLTLFLQRKA